MRKLSKSGGGERGNNIENQVCFGGCGFDMDFLLVESWVGGFGRDFMRENSTEVWSFLCVYEG